MLGSPPCKPGCEGKLGSWSHKGEETWRVGDENPCGLEDQELGLAVGCIGTGGLECTGDPGGILSLGSRDWPMMHDSVPGKRS